MLLITPLRSPLFLISAVVLHVCDTIVGDRAESIARHSVMVVLDFHDTLVCGRNRLYLSLESLGNEYYNYYIEIQFSKVRLHKK